MSYQNTTSTTLSGLVELQSPPPDAISSVAWSPNSQKLAVTSWDSCLRIYSRKGDIFDLVTHEYRAPVLDVTWLDDNFIAFVGLDGLVNRFNAGHEEGACDALSMHGAASNKVAYSQQHGLLISTSWDLRMHVQSPRGDKYVAVQLPAKPFALSLTADKVVVSMADRKVQIYELAELKAALEASGRDPLSDLQNRTPMQPIQVKPFQSRDSNLKFMTRDVACLPDGTGFASSSIEGRVAVEWFDEEANKQTYAFKCHRDKTTVMNDETGDAKPMDIIYPVNAIAFHPIHGTFATGGGDGTVLLWDAQNKRRTKGYSKLESSIAALDFSPDGKMLAIGISPGFEDGQEESVPDPALLKVYVRFLKEDEAKGKPAKGKKEKSEG